MIRLFFLLLPFLAACSNPSGLNLGFYPDPKATPESFIVCHGYGCAQKTLTGFTNKQWRRIGRIFKKKSKTAESERQKIARAIALMETYIGQNVGLQEDLPRAPILRSSNKELDCIDETINTNKYLGFLQAKDLLHWHVLGRPVHRGFFINGVYPHNSASIKEIKTSEKNPEQIFVVDSYIFKNGEEPIIVPLKYWLSHALSEYDKKS